MVQNWYTGMFMYIGTWLNLIPVCTSIFYTQWIYLIYNVPSQVHPALQYSHTVKSVRSQLNSEVEIVPITNGACRPSVATLSAVLKHVVGVHMHAILFIVHVHNICVYTCTCADTWKVRCWQCESKSVEMVLISPAHLIFFRSPRHIWECSLDCSIYIIHVHALIHFIILLIGNHTFAAIKGCESYHLLQMSLVK